MAQVQRYRPRSRKSLVGLATVPISVVVALTSRLARNGSEPAPDTGRHGRIANGGLLPDAPPAVEPVEQNPVETSPVESAPAGYYRVAEGDSVSSIALANGLSTAAVLARNGLGWRTPIFPGQVLRLVPVPRSPNDSSPEKPDQMFS